jgi:hypothetical protein
MILRIVIVLSSLLLGCCKPKLVASAKDIESAEIRVELKNLWILLEDYRTTHGHFPEKLSNLEGIDSILSNEWDYTPNDSQFIVKSIEEKNGFSWRMSVNGAVTKSNHQRTAKLSPPTDNTPLDDEGK